MIFYLIGIDYRKVPLTLQETSYGRRLAIKEALTETASILFTCQRLEIYGLAGDIHSVLRIKSLLSGRFPDIFSRAYLKIGIKAVTRYGLRLACGLESQILGEPQIIAQLRQWSQASQAPALRELWQKILNQAQAIKADSRLKIPEVDLSKFVFQDLRVKLNKQKKEILVAGTGAVAQLFARNKPDDFIINFASRKKHSRARQLARVSGGKAILLDQVGEFVPRIDALVGATASPHYILQEKHLISLDKRTGPLYVYDLAVPRDVLPQLAKLEQIVLEDLRSLNGLFDEHRNRYLAYVREIEALIEERVDEDIANGNPAELVSLKTGQRDSW